MNKNSNMKDNETSLTRAIPDGELEKVAGGTGGEITEHHGYKVSPRASWCPHCRQEVEPDSLSLPHTFDGITCQDFSCTNCNQPYTVISR